MDKLLKKYGDRLRSVSYYPTNKVNTWRLIIRGEETKVDGRTLKGKDTKIYSSTFEGLVNNKVLEVVKIK